MTHTIFVELVGTVGLPIALVIAMGLFIYKIYKKSEHREDALREQIVNYQVTNAEAIKTLALYAERLGSIETDIKAVKQDVMLISEHISHT